MTVLDWVYLLYGSGMVNLLAAHSRNRVFLAQTHAILSTLDLERFKDLARRNMYSSLIQIAVLGAGAISGIYGVRSGRVNFSLLTVLNGVIIVVSLVLKRTERKTQRLPVSDKLLENQYADICHTWMNRAFPNF